MKTINLKNILNSKGSFSKINEDLILKAMKEAIQQALELAAENALEVDYIERSMDKSVYGQILDTINQVV